MHSSIRTFHFRLIFLMLLIIDLIFSFIYEYNGAQDGKDGLGYIFIGITLIAIYVIGIRKNESRLFARTDGIRWMYVGIILSGVLLVLSVFLKIFQLWLAGCIIISAVYSIYLGSAGVVMFVCIYGISNGISISEFLFYLILGVILCCLTGFYPAVRSQKACIIAYIYSVITGLCCHAALYIITNNLDYTVIYDIDSCIMLTYTVVLITCMYIFITFFVKPGEYDEKVNEAIDNLAEGVAGITAADAADNEADKQLDDNEKNDEQTDRDIQASTASDTGTEAVQETMQMNIEETTLETAQGNLLETIEENLQETVQETVQDVEPEPEPEDHSLIEWFEKENPSLFKRRSLLATFAGRAAKCIEADKERAYLGVLYSEIGMLVNRADYVNEGIRMVKEKKLPDYYINVIESYKLKTDFPQSKEAVIVYLTLFLFNMYHFYNKPGFKGNKVPMTSVVDKTFKLRLNDGSFDMSGLTIEDYNRLKQFYIDYFKEKD